MRRITNFGYPTADEAEKILDKFLRGEEEESESMKPSKTPRARQVRLTVKRTKRTARDKAMRRRQRIIANPGCRGK